LVVEDNLLNQQVAEELLSGEGGLVSLAANGRLGVDAVAAATPQFDVVLMDLQMPVMDGFGATHAIRQQLGLKALPIVAMTANALDSDRDACLAAGMNAHVGKPFDLSKLVSLLLQITGRDTPDVAAPAPSATAAVVAALPAGVIDVAGALTRMGGATGLYQRAARAFVEALPTLASDWGRAVVADPRQAAMQMHTLKGTAAMVGASALSAVAGRLNQQSKTATPSELALELPALDAAAQSTLVALRHVITALQGDSNGVDKGNGATARRALDAQVVRDALVILMPLLENGDLDALDVFAQRRVTLACLPDALLEPLEMALQALEMEAAHEACKAIEVALDLLESTT